MDIPNQEKNLTDSLKEGQACIEMSLNDVMVYTQEHFNVVKDLIIKHEELTHILTKVAFREINIDKGKVVKDKDFTPNNSTNEPISDPYVIATVMTPIHREIDDINLVVCNVFLQIHDFTKQYIRFH